MVHLLAHIPRTGGSTLRAWIMEVPGIKVCFEGSRQDLLRCYNNHKDKSTVVLMSHWLVGIHYKLSNFPKYMAIIRDPVERMVSEYNLCKRQKRHHLHKEANKMSLIDFTKTHRMPNTQTRHIIGVNDETTEIYEGDITPSKMKIALRNFSYIGLYENFTKSTTDIFKIMGLDLIYLEGLKDEYTNTAAKVEKLSAKEKDFLKEYSRFDQTLYEQAREQYANIQT